MTTFSYAARDKAGALLNGAIEATCRTQALKQLSRMGLTPFSLEAISTTIDSSSPASFEPVVEIAPVPAKNSFGNIMMGALKAGAKELQRSAKRASLKSQIIKLKHLDLPKAYRELGLAAFEQEIGKEAFPELHARIVSSQNLISEKRKGVHAEAADGFKDKAKAIAKTAKMKADAVFINKTRRETLGLLGRKIYEASLNNEALQNKFYSIGAILSRITDFEASLEALEKPQGMARKVKGHLSPRFVRPASALSSAEVSSVPGEVKKRIPFLTVYLALLIGWDLLFLYHDFAMRRQIESDNPTVIMTFGWSWFVWFLQRIVNIISLFAIFRWRKWGFYGYFASVALTVFMMLKSHDMYSNTIIVNALYIISLLFVFLKIQNTQGKTGWEMLGTAHSRYVSAKPACPQCSKTKIRRANSKLAFVISLLMMLLFHKSGVVAYVNFLVEILSKTEYPLTVMQAETVYAINIFVILYAVVATWPRKNRCSACDHKWR